MSARTSVKSIQDIMRQDTGVDGDAQRLSQLCWMFFLKIIDDQDQQLEVMQDHYRSPIPSALQWCTWAADPEGMTGDALMDFVNGTLFPSLKALPTIGKGAARARVVKGVFEDAYNYMKSGQLMRQVLNKINGVDFNDLADRRHFGEIYEQLLNDLQSAGNAGEYYTPRALTQFMCGPHRPETRRSDVRPQLRHRRLPHLRHPRLGGRAAIVLPDGSLFGEGVKTRLKEHLLAECNLHTVVRLPNSVFRPYASIGTNLLFFEKGEPTQDIWFYEHRVPAGQKAYSMTKPIRVEHLQGCVDWWGGAARVGRQETPQAWRVSLDDVKARGYNLDIKNPHSVADEHGDPAELLAALDRAEAETAKLRAQLKTILAEERWRG